MTKKLSLALVFTVVLQIAGPAFAAENSLAEEQNNSSAAPLVNLSPDTPLDAAALLPIGGPITPVTAVPGSSTTTVPGSSTTTVTGTSTTSLGSLTTTTPESSTTASESSTATPSLSSPLITGISTTRTTTTSSPSPSGIQYVIITDGPIIIDNDLEKDLAVTEYIWKEIPDTDGKIHIDAGGRFPVTVVTSHTSKTAKVGDPVEARLKVDIKIGGRMIAPKGATVIGHIASCVRARKMLQAEFSTKRWMRPSGALGVQFDEIRTASGDHIPLVALPAQQPRIVKNMAQGRVLGVNHKGEIVSPLSGQVKAQVAHIGIRAAAGPFSFGAVPIAFGLAGAISPSFAFMHPVGKNMRHRRLKGFGLGVVSGLPGGFLLTDYMIRGDEAIIQPGDEFLAEFKQKFTGEKSSEAQLAPNARIKVRGQVLPEPKK